MKIELLNYDDLERMFGVPGIANTNGTFSPVAAVKNSLVSVKAPFPLKYLDGRTVIQNIVAHPHVANAIADALEEILEVYGPEGITRHGLDNYGGCYCVRRSVNSSSRQSWWSVHSWGLAIDYLPSVYGPYRVPPATPAFVVEAFERRGFMWGGRSVTARDGMHFTAVKNKFGEAA
jgi:hypothetical protein